MSTTAPLTAADAATANSAAAAANPGQGPRGRANEKAGEKARRSPWRSPATILALVILAIAFLWALVPGVFATHDPYKGTDVALLSPSSEHLFGTDSVGRDLYSRVVYGARQSLLGALIAVAVGLVLGTLIGLVAGTQRGWLDTVLMRLVDVLLAIPGILLSLSIIIVTGFGSLQAAFAVGMTSVATFARLARSQVIQVAGADFVEAAYGSGASNAQVLFRHVLPNVTEPILVIATINLALAIITEATLSFLGSGMPDTMPSLGTLIRIGNNYLFAGEWWIVAFPGIALAGLILSINLLGDWLRDALNPKLR